MVQTYDVQLETRETQPTAIISTELPVPQIGPWLARAYRIVADVISAHGTSPAGPPFARYHQLAAGRFAVEAGFPVVTAIEPDAGVRPSYLPGGPAAVTIHAGRYEGIAPAYTALATWISAHGGTPEGDPWEIYLSDPGKQPDPGSSRTEIVQPYGQA